jgi:hypothetical protein
MVYLIERRQASPPSSMKANARQSGGQSRKYYYTIKSHSALKYRSTARQALAPLIHCLDEIMPMQKSQYRRLKTIHQVMCADCGCHFFPVNISAYSSTGRRFDNNAPSSSNSSPSNTHCARERIFSKWEVPHVFWPVTA